MTEEQAREKAVNVIHEWDGEKKNIVGIFSKALPEAYEAGKRDEREEIAESIILGRMEFPTDYVVDARGFMPMLARQIRARSSKGGV